MTTPSSVGAGTASGASRGGAEAGVLVRRGEVVESRHRVHVAVVDADGRVARAVGDPTLVTFYRSAAKPFQALPLVADGAADAFGLEPRELAVCCGSHDGSGEHVAVVRSILSRAGVPESALGCGPHPPMGEAHARRLAASGRDPQPIHNNCSGKHAGMLALAVHHRWPLEGYLEPDHPVQLRMLDEVARWSGIDPAAIGTGEDGCGVVCFAVPLGAMAASFARLAAAAARGSAAPARVVGAMAAHPEMVAGEGRTCTRVMKVAAGRVVVKTGAEGVYGGLVRSGPSAGTGIALKVEDGGRRASGAALIRVLELLGALEEGDPEDGLGDLRRPPVRNTLGHVVGRIEADFGLEAIG